MDPRKAILAALLAGWAGKGTAMTADGTIVTNMVSMTFSSPTGIGYTVSFAMTAVAVIQSPSVTLTKTVSPTSMGAGGTLTFCISLVNNHRTDSAFNLHVEDIIPGASGVMAYVSGQDNWVDGTAGATVVRGYGGRPPWNVFMTQYWGAEMPAGQTGPYAIRWVISMMGPGKSAILCWKARVL